MTRSRLGLVLVVCASAAIVSCTGGSGQVIEPRPDFKYGEGCTVPWGVAKVGELLYALNQQDVGAVERLFPATGDWDLEIGPSIARRWVPVPGPDAERSGGGVKRSTLSS